MKPDSHVLITGASRGFGAACAEVFHRHGCRVSAFARSREELEALEQRLGAERCCAIAGDITGRGSIDESVRRAEQRFGPIDILINNAGLGLHKPLLEHRAEDITQQVVVNVAGLIHFSHAVAGSMVSRREGVILNIASDLARKPLANMAVYTATKHAVAGFSTSLTRELRPFGIKVMLVNPGIINTHFGGRQPKETTEPWQMNPSELAELLVTMIRQPGGLLIDEMTVHPMGQEF